MTAVISTTALCLAATSSLSPFLVPHAPFLLATARPHHLRFLSLFSSILPLPYTSFSLLLILFFCSLSRFVLSILRFYRISDHVTVLYERVAFRKTRHNPPLKDSLPGAWNFQLTLQGRMYFYLLIEASIPKYPKPCC